MNIMTIQFGRRHTCSIQVLFTVIATTLGTWNAYGQAHLREAWFFNEPAGSAPDGTLTLGINGTAGTIRGAGADFTGSGLSLPGGDSSVAAYLDLPNGLFSAMSDASFEFWVTVRSNQRWQRIFDFGSGTAGELTGPGGYAVGDNYLFLSANRDSQANTQRLEWNTAHTGVDTEAELPLDALQHIVVTFDDREDIGQPSLISWFLNGSLVGSQENPQRLATLNDVNNWLGRSQYTVNANSDMLYDSFAIYDVSFPQSQVLEQFHAGPDSPAFSPIPEPSTWGAVAFVVVILAWLSRLAERKR